jgi:membrane-bound lytic murein transglycosylase D
MRLRLFRASHLVVGLAFSLPVFSVFGQVKKPQHVVLQDSCSEQPALVIKGSGVVTVVSDKLIEDRMNQMSSCLDVRTTAVVKSYLTGYLRRAERTKQILSRRLTYFPLFERVLQEHGVPDDLKYLAVVESALNPVAVSRVGASGLWQFMPYTGTDYGMQINSAVDERNNVVKSTEGAAEYLKHLYLQFNDWALALAAYNSGPNRVNSAIRRAGSRNFWIIQRYLPKETRDYVPAFIAASYICNFFSEHNLDFDLPDLDVQLTDHITVYDGMSFSAIAKATGLSYQTVADLNPGFKRAYVPPSTRGYYVTLPKRVMPAFVRYLNGLGGNKYALEGADYYSTDPAANGAYYQTLVKCNEPEFVDRFAQKIGTTGAHLRAWNNIEGIYVQPNQTLRIWKPVPVLKHLAGVEAPVEKPVETPIPTEKVNAAAPTSLKATGKQYLFHKVSDGESIHDLSRRYGVSVDRLVALNNVTELRVGMLLRIKEI